MFFVFFGLKCDFANVNVFRCWLGFVVLGFVVLGFVVLGFVVLGFVVLGFVVLGFVVLGSKLGVVGFVVCFRFIGNVFKQLLLPIYR
jgi:hypothetical protein